MFGRSHPPKPDDPLDPQRDDDAPNDPREAASGEPPQPKVYDDFDAMTREIDGYEETISRLQREKEETNQRLLRTIADYQNSQRRAISNEKEAKSQGVRSVTLNMLTVLDHFDLALGVDTTKASAQDVVNGVKLIRDELMRVLTTHGVAPINPQAGDEFDPQRHQAVMQDMTTEGVEPGRITRTLQPGYSLDDRVVRPAMVAVRANA